MNGNTLDYLARRIFGSLGHSHRCCDECRLGREYPGCHLRDDHDSRGSLSRADGDFCLGMVLPATAAWVTAQSRRKDYHPITLALPTPKLPVPNAFDIFCKAGTLLRDVKLTDAVYVDVYYTNPDHLSEVVTKDDVQGVIANNSRAIALFQQALSQNFWTPPRRTNASRTYIPYWLGLMQLITLEGKGRVATGDWNGAAQCALDIMQFGSTIPHGADFAVNALGYQFQENSREDYRYCIQHLQAVQARQAIRRLTWIEQQQASFADVLQEDLYTNYAVMKSTNIDILPAQSNNAQQQTRRRFREALLDLYIKCMQQDIANARLPYAKQQPYPSPQGPYAEELVPDVESWATRIAFQQMKYDFLLLATALHAYHVEHTNYPAKLGELAPGYLTALPNDVFAAQGGYNYKLNGRDYCIYSVGPDGHDDGGTPLVETPGKDGKPGTVSKNSHGDIVAESGIW